MSKIRQGISNEKSNTKLLCPLHNHILSLLIVQVLLLHRPFRREACTLYNSTAKGESSPPAMLLLPGGEKDGTSEILLCAQVSPAGDDEQSGGLGPCFFFMQPSNWQARMRAPLTSPSSPHLSNNLRPFHCKALLPWCVS